MGCAGFSGRGGGGGLCARAESEGGGSGFVTDIADDVLRLVACVPLVGGGGGGALGFLISSWAAE